MNSAQIKMTLKEDGLDLDKNIKDALTRVSKKLATTGQYITVELIHQFVYVELKQMVDDLNPDQ